MLPHNLEETYNEFYKLVQTNKTLDPKTTRLLQLAASMAVGCYPWMEYYLDGVGDLGITEDEIGTVLSIVMAVSGGRVRAQLREVKGRGKRRDGK